MSDPIWICSPVVASSTVTTTEAEDVAPNSFAAVSVTMCVPTEKPIVATRSGSDVAAIVVAPSLHVNVSG